MESYVRTYPDFSLCGLNCALCPRHHTQGPSRCPGCGGPRFSELHPSCPIIRCSRTQGNVEFCHACDIYPCERYEGTPSHDSFISYSTRLDDQKQAASEGLDTYLARLAERKTILEHLLHTCDDGRRKGFYCLAANLLQLENLREVTDAVEKLDLKTTAERAAAMVIALQEQATAQGIMLKLRTKER